MLLTEYLTDINQTIAAYIQTGLIVSSDVISDIRTDNIGLLKGVISFWDGSTLFFKEYLDLRYHLDKKTYSFHYQDDRAVLRLRYDNADHKPDLGVKDHKHTPGDIRSATIPNLYDVLGEIVNTYLTEQ